ncbi:MAG: FHA domain-containing protein [Bacteroidales bacterium]|jgi:hypothetical protein|nr:FHA domain-containing protein [Bacteroidales bacterium]
MKIECIHCKGLVTVPEEVIRSSKKLFICHLCHTKQQIKTEQTMKKAGKLCVYRDKDLKNPIETHELFVRRYVVGRTSQEKKQDIPILEGDDHLGRQHFILDISQNVKGLIECTIRDYNSKNGTKIVRGKQERELRPTDKIVLEKNDKIIAGVTTFEVQLIELEQKDWQKDNRGECTDRTVIT